MCVYSALLSQGLSECEDSNYTESPDHISGEFKGRESLLLSVNVHVCLFVQHWPLVSAQVFHSGFLQSLENLQGLLFVSFQLSISIEKIKLDLEKKFIL